MVMSPKRSIAVPWRLSLLSAVARRAEDGSETPGRPQVRLTSASQTGGSPLPAAECSRVPVSVHYGNIAPGRDLAPNTLVCGCCNTC